MKAVSLYILFAACSYISKAQSFPELNFTHITTREGLSSDLTMCVAEDKQGFIWIGTSNGLNRYDGYRLKQYFHNENDPNSVPDNTIDNLYCDSKGRLWISTNQGASCFLPDSNRFINYTANERPPFRLAKDRTPHFYEDEQKNMWIIVNEEGIYRVDKDMTLDWIPISTPPFIFQYFQRKGYTDIARDPDGNEWSFNGNRIYLLNKQTKLIARIFDLSAYLPDKSILSFNVDKEGRYWIATWGTGIWQFLPAADKLVHLGSLPPGVYYPPQKWEYDGKKWMVIAELNTGLYLVDPENRQTKNYFIGFPEALSLQGLEYKNTFVDHRGSLWICSDRGVNMVAGYPKMFDVYKIGKTSGSDFDPHNNGQFFGFTQIDSLYWFNKRYSCTFLLSRTMHLARHYPSLYPLNGKTVRSTSSAYSFYRDSNNLFMSTDSGVVEYHLKEQTSRLYLPSAFTPVAHLRNIVRLNDHEVWIRSFDNGIFVFDIRKKAFTRWYSNIDSCSACLPYILNWMLRTKEGRLFISSSDDGLIEYNQRTDNFIKHSIRMEGKGVLEAGTIFGMAEDEMGKLWLCTGAGIYVYNPHTGKTEQHFSGGGGMGETYRICFDKYHNAWINGKSGIWCYLRTKKKWIPFTTLDGLPGSDFEGFLAMDDQENIWCGLVNAVVRFYPDRIISPAEDRPVIITEGVASGKSIPFPLNNTSAKKLVIRPGENYFTIDFAVLDCSNANQSRYYYRLEPLMKDFEQNADGHLNFSGLPNGSYRLQVRGGDKFGNINPSTDTLDIRVEPFFWQTAWFRIALVTASIVLLSWLIRRRIRNIKKESTLKQRIVESEMMALRAQMNPHFIFNCLNSIDNLIQDDQKEKATVYLAKFARLIRAILENSKKETIPCWKDAEALELYLEMEMLRLDDKFLYSVDVDEKIMRGNYKVPPMILQPFVENAIHHGLLNKLDADKQLHITARVSNGSIKYTIEDNGVGRTRAAEYKKINRPSHQSMGMQITTERINYFNESERSAIRITDLYKEDGTPAGTRVEICLNNQN